MGGITQEGSLLVFLMRFWVIGIGDLGLKD